MFLKKTWPVIKQDVYAAIKKFFLTGKLYKAVNCTAVTLLHKVPNPASIKEYRPIACCTVLYKLIAKVLANRIQQVIAKVISETQAGFIPGRKVADNIILTHELVKAYNRKNISPRCMIKVDIQKAYDTVDWCYLEQVMAALGFPSKFTSWVMKCVATVSYSFVLNGEQTKPFEAARGLRQGDPMSPFLFAIVVEYLSRNLHELASHKQFKYHPMCSKLKITHLCFADDLLMFTRGDQISVNMLHTKFKEFTEASGLQANLSKSALYFGGVSEVVREQIQQMLGYSLGTLPFRYLGIPLSTKKLNVIQWHPVIGKIVAKITFWTAKKLSYAGRIQLVRSVIFGIQANWAQMFVIAAKVMKTIPAFCRSYIWSGANNITKKALVSWEKMCTPKVAGGLNMVNLKLWNKAAILKLCWDLSKSRTNYGLSGSTVIISKITT